MTCDIFNFLFSEAFAIFFKPPLIDVYIYIYITADKIKIDLVHVQFRVYTISSNVKNAGIHLENLFSVINTLRSITLFFL